MNTQGIDCSMVKLPEGLNAEEFSCWFCEKVVVTATKCKTCRTAVYCGNTCRLRDWIRPNGHSEQCARECKKHKSILSEQVVMSISDEAKKALFQAVIKHATLPINAEEIVCNPQLRIMRLKRK